MALSAYPTLHLKDANLYRRRYKRSIFQKRIEENKLHIRHLAIRNFRAIVDVDCDLGPRINVIVGPNGVGKTTVLQALRLTKAILAPRTQNEPQQVLISLGAASPHFPQRLFLNGLANDQTQPVEIRCTYELESDEIETLISSKLEIVQNIVAAQAGQKFTNPAALIDFLQSEAGQTASKNVFDRISNALSDLEKTRTLMVGLTIGGPKGIFAPVNEFGGLLIGFLDQKLSPISTLFSYFPADRALPMGEVNLQLGGQDTQLQLESHNSQPQLKYQRLKNIIINSLLMDRESKSNIESEFEIIFSRLLKGRTIKTIGLNELGLMSVITEETLTGKLVELDSLSSGEKNIALTFLIVAGSIARGGIALFDEPELHLNPAVCRDLLPFMVNNYSAEILSGAFSNSDCKLLHLKSATDMTPVGKSARDEYEDALVRLGTSVSESLFYEGTILVEGSDDVAFLKAAFPDIVQKLNIKPKGGRSVIENSIQELQTLESNGERIDPIYMLFDRDGAPTDFRNSKAVRIAQWSRRCVENYMIDLDVIAFLMKDSSITKSPIESAGQVSRLLRDLAFKQLVEISARETYNSYQYKNASLQRADLKGDDLNQIGENLFLRMSGARDSLSDKEKTDWINKFCTEANNRKAETSLIWESSWQELCDGKKLISDLYKAGNFTMSESSLKLRITEAMRNARSESWKLARTIIMELLKIQSPQ